MHDGLRPSFNSMHTTSAAAVAAPTLHLRQDELLQEKGRKDDVGDTHQKKVMLCH